MKKIIVFFLLISSLSYSQFNIRGTMSPTENSSWVLLYKIEGTKQIFVKNTQVKKKLKKGFLNFHYQMRQNLVLTVLNIV